MYNNLHPPASLKSGSTYHLFRDEIRPEWEDSENEKGGKWVVIPPANRINEMWESLLLSCIGETACESETEICGVVISIRKKQSKLSIWTKNSSADVSKTIGYETSSSHYVLHYWCLTHNLFFFFFF